MPSRIDNAPRTKSGRLSRAFVPKLDSLDLKKIKADAAAEETARLEKVEALHPTALLYDAATAVDAAATAAEELREERNRIVVDLWAFQSARGETFWEAAGVIPMVLWRAKKRVLGVDAIPKVPGTKLTVDWEAVRDLATKAGIVPDPNAKQRLPQVSARIAELEGRHGAAIAVRDRIILELIETGLVTRPAAGRMIARDASTVSRLMTRLLEIRAQRESDPQVVSA